MYRFAVVLAGFLVVMLSGCGFFHPQMPPLKNTTTVLMPDDHFMMRADAHRCIFFWLFCEDIPPELDPYRVWYGTNRKPIQANNPREAISPSAGFSNSRDEILHFGVAHVQVPKSHQFGSRGSSWLARTITLIDDRLRVERMYSMNEEDFVHNLRFVVRARKPGHRTALIYIHGYNVNFEEAVTQAAQIGYDLKVEGITAVYSWPSKSSVLSYPADEATVETSEPFLKEFLLKISEIPGVEEIDVIAHSMGNRAFLRVVEAMAPAMRKAGKKFGQIILAAPDVDVDTFKRVAAAFPTISSRTTLYVSSKDLAVRMSEWLHEYPRVGFYPPLTLIPGIDTIQVSNIDLTLLGHSYIAEAEAVLYDMFNLLHGNLSPQQRIRLVPRPSGVNPEYWEVAR